MMFHSYFLAAVLGCCCLLTGLNANDSSRDVSGAAFDGQAFTSSKEKPELDPVLSALIGEDVKKNIEARRLVEENENRLRTREAKELEAGVTESNSYVLTTEKQKPNAGLVDQELSLDGSGTENKQTSRIQIKTGPNGVDYEYEYVYYYYDEDEDDKKSSKVKETESSKTTTDGRGKNRYTSGDRPAEQENSRTKSRQPVSRSDDAESEERLPQNTRFPPRASVTAAPVEEVKQQQKIRRPSLDLVDSVSFNTEDKASKGGRGSTEAGSASAKDIYETKAETEDGVDTTTSTMEKAAFDLYVILQNENANNDATTTQITTDVTGESVEEVTTEEEIETTEEPTTTTTTTTTPKPTTTTTTTSTTTTTTTTTTEAPVETRKGGALTAGRNRFKFRSHSPTSTTEPSTTEAPKSKSRFARPSSFNGRRTAAAASTTTTEANEVKENTNGGAQEDSKPAPSFGGRPTRTRNRFSLRGQQPAAEKTDVVEEKDNAIDAAPSSTARPRARPTFNIRPRGRPTPSTTAAAPAEEGAEHNDEEVKEVEKPTPASPIAARSRLNLARPANRLLPNRAKPNILSRGSTTTAAPAEPAPEAESPAADEDLEQTDVPSEVNEKVEVEEKQPVAEVPAEPVSGLNRLKSRPRINVVPNVRPKPQPVAINRKANPLIARRNPFTSTTEAAPVEEGEDAEEENHNGEAAPEAEKTEDLVEAEPSEAPPAEQARGLGGLLANRRRPLLRRPGNLA